MFPFPRKKATYMNEEQKRVLVDFMGNHPELVSGKFTSTFSQLHAQALWQEISDELHKIPGAVKDWKQWRKQWNTPTANEDEDDDQMGIEYLDHDEQDVENFVPEMLKPSTSGTPRIKQIVNVNNIQRIQHSLNSSKRPAHFAPQFQKPVTLTMQKVNMPSNTLKAENPPNPTATSTPKRKLCTDSKVGLAKRMTRAARHESAVKHSGQFAEVAQRELNLNRTYYKAKMLYYNKKLKNQEKNLEIQEKNLEISTQINESLKTISSRVDKYFSNIY